MAQAFLFLEDAVRGYEALPLRLLPKANEMLDHLRPSAEVAARGRATYGSVVGREQLVIRFVVRSDVIVVEDISTRVLGR
jgi:hypothetical protein